MVQQPAYTSVHPGGSVTLSCSAHTRHCTTEHISFMWFKISDGSDPEIVDSSETKSNGCREMEDKTTSCVNRLHSDAAGTYYCVVTSCGFMRFGNGTRIKNGALMCVAVAHLNRGLPSWQQVISVFSTRPCHCQKHATKSIASNVPSI